MEKQAIQNEWRKLISEIENKPNIEGCYPPSVARNRELLLFAQVKLAKIETGENIKFHTEIYQTIMKHYFKQKRLMNEC